MNNKSEKVVPSKTVQKKFVDTLFMQAETLFTGWFAQSLCCVLSFFETRHLEYFWFIALLSIVLFARLIDVRYFNRTFKRKSVSEVTEKQLRYWEFRYIVGSGSAAVVLGIITAYTLYTNPISVSALAAVGLSLGTMISVVGKNYPSKANIDVLVGIVCASIFLPLVVKGIETSNPLLVCLSFMLMPLALITRQMAGGVREVLHDSIRSLLSSERTWKLFHFALEYMPGGLIMINEDGKLSLMNQKAAKMFGIKDVDTVIAAKVSLPRMVAFAIHNHEFDRKDGRNMINRLHDLMTGKAATHTIEMGKQHIRLSINRLPKRRKDDEDSIGGAVLICEDVTSQMIAKKEVQYLADYDALSALPVRRHMNDLIENAVETMAADELIAISIFDIDKFKVINDSLGHAMGDEAIRMVGEALNSLNHPNILRGRWGGDEFVIAFHGLKNDDDVEELFNTVFDTVCKTYHFSKTVEGKSGLTTKSHKTLDIKCSGGVIVCGKAEFNLDDALKKADHALLSIKQEPGVYWCRFDAKMNEERTRSERLREDFRTGLRNGDVRAVYQPMFTPDGKMIAACEALARWEHPEFGPVSPGIFIPMAESNGFIHELTRTILNAACQDCMTWPDRSVSVSVNLSAIDLANRDIISVIEQALKNSGLDPSRLQVEVTESVFLKDREQAAAILHQLRSIGVKTAIDDFGTGYSNLAYLKHLPLDKLKIDRSFVTNVDKDEQAAHFFDALVVFSRSLHFDVVVEGVETKEQLDVINRSNVNLIQGFYFGRPMEKEAVHAKIDSLTMPRNRVVSNVLPILRHKAI